MTGSDAVIEWLLESPEPWTRYRARIDLLGQTEDAPDVRDEHHRMISHPQVQALVAAASTWGQTPFKRHNDAGYPIYKLSTLADFGLKVGDPGMAGIAADVMAHQSPEGVFMSLVNIPAAFGGTGADQWTWMVCDAPTLLYSLASFGLGQEERVQQAFNHLIGLVDDNGYRCRVDPALGKFRGPGARGDPCPVANVFVLKSLSMIPNMQESAAAHAAAEMLLQHWASPPGKKYYLFGVGNDFRKLKYPFVWYDILHVADALSRFAFTRSDPRLQSMVAAIAAQAGPDGYFSPGSMYQVWKGWSFADKKHPSPWLTFLVLRVLKRMTF